MLFITSTITLRPACAWFTDDLQTANKHLHALECKKKHSGLKVHAMIFDSAKDKFYIAHIKEACDQGALFRTSNHMLHKDTDLLLPAYVSPKALGEDFVGFCKKKIIKIGNALVINSNTQPWEMFPEPPRTSTDTMNNYHPISNLSYMSKLIEHVVAVQLDANMARKDLLAPFQSACLSPTLWRRQLSMS